MVHIMTVLLLLLQVWYKTIREIPPGEELLLGPKAPLPLQDVFGSAGKLTIMLKTVIVVLNIPNI